MNNPSKKWNHRKFGWLCPGKFGIGPKGETKKRAIRSDKKKSKRRLVKYFKDSGFH